MSFLGYKISSLGSQPLPEWVADLQACPPPKSVSHLRGVLGMLNFAWLFFPTVFPFKPLFMTSFAVPELKTPIPSPGPQHSSQLSTSVKQDWLELLFWHTQIQRLHSPWSRMLQLPPWVLSSNNERKAPGSPSPSFPGNSARRNKNRAPTTGSSWRSMRPWDTSATCLRLVILPFWRTISHLGLPTKEGQVFAKAVQPTGLYLPVYDGHSSHIWPGQYRCRRAFPHRSNHRARNSWRACRSPGWRWRTPNTTGE